LALLALTGLLAGFSLALLARSLLALFSLALAGLALLARAALAALTLTLTLAALPLLHSLIPLTSLTLLSGRLVHSFISHGNFLGVADWLAPGCKTCFQAIRSAGLCEVTVLPILVEMRISRFASAFCIT
jgi:hypothetical protein